MHRQITIIGAGLAGCEAAWQLAQKGFKVNLLEQKPLARTPAQKSDHLAELVCSNSLRSADPENAVGLLKQEMRSLNSLIIQMADRHRIPGGSALVVDREGFSEGITEAIKKHPHIKVGSVAVTAIPSDRPLVIATGPLTTPAFAQAIQSLTATNYLYFYDSIAPIVEVDSINREIAFKASRYDKGEADYLNCPMTKEEYETFVNELISSEKVPAKDFEKEIYFEGCLPIEVMAARGLKTLAFGPMKPVGLTDPRTCMRPYAVVQLRQDDLHASLYNMVGFQTRMKYPEQMRVFRKVPGLENAQFVRLGSMHRNTYINSPQLLNPYLELKNHPGIYFAGQICGVEGYVESAAMGLYVGQVLGARLQNRDPDFLSTRTGLGALVRHITEASSRGFQPMNVNFGLFEIAEAERKKISRKELVEGSLKMVSSWQQQLWNL
ncbi:MAG: methylenetetrahydrofolate--tRNA-(uracil(54)-C(5))-methyltransferase (FADH(2)-oxidizing) TrmFO [Deltaproteobacteria bacterium]|nr:methylenetetrahydrofolate--tRNA-(uracil(54)-C(5))-methyltransferase (FADH(2)-oxidizing) TrmFO [Deltaproteobacteria bacterium]